ncbi:hypothetical protein D1007_50243 [Hordeum vulgare]|nr:hypothetical protein D1007_50243 [Hordeum vulgare]
MGHTGRPRPGYHRALARVRLELPPRPRVSRPSPSPPLAISVAALDHLRRRPLPVDALDHRCRCRTPPTISIECCSRTLDAPDHLCRRRRLRRTPPSISVVAGVSPRVCRLGRHPGGRPLQLVGDNED